MLAKHNLMDKPITSTRNSLNEWLLLSLHPLY
nr:MAG TPA: hypothetical protein [Bacteriophage sp.]